MQESSGVIGNFDHSKPTRIYGAGISGLLIGYFLKQNGHQNFTIYEKESRLGGKIHTLNKENGLVESAANAIYTNDDVHQLLNELSIKFIKANPKLKRKVYRKGRVYSPPFKFIELLKIFFNLFKKCPPLDSKTTIYDFFLPWMGKDFVDEVLSSALSGVYATTAENLHFLSIFKVQKPTRYFHFMKQMKAKRKSQKNKMESISFQNGMSDFVDALEKKLESHILKETKGEFDPNYNNIICTDAFNAAILIEDHYPQISHHLKKINYQKVTTTTFHTRDQIEDLQQSFGILISKNEKKHIMGILNNTAIFNRKKNEHYSYTIISKSIALNEADILDELSSLGIKIKDSHTTQIKWERAIPLYDHSRAQSILQLRVLLLDKSVPLCLFGNYVDGISIREMVSHAKDFAKKNSKSFKRTD
jgi:protoporphyrinogen oxidase